MWRFLLAAMAMPKAPLLHTWPSVEWRHCFRFTLASKYLYIEVNIDEPHRHHCSPSRAVRIKLKFPIRSRRPGGAARTQYLEIESSYKTL